MHVVGRAEAYSGTTSDTARRLDTPYGDSYRFSALLGCESLAPMTAVAGATTSQQPNHDIVVAAHGPAKYGLSYNQLYTRC